MPTKKITELTSYAANDINTATDVLPIVDITNTETKKATIDAMLSKYTTNTNVYYVSPQGDNSIAENGNINKPYQTIEGARAAAVAAGETSGSLINVLPGVYTEGTLTTSYIGNFYFHPGAVVSGSSGVKMFDVDSNTLNVYGYGDFHSLGSFIELSTSGTGYFECRNVTQASSNTFCYLDGTAELTFKANKVEFKSVMSAAGFTSRDGSILTTHIDEFDSSNGNFDFHFRQGGQSSIYSGVANVNVKKWTKHRGYCWLVGNVTRDAKTFLNVDQWFITGSTVWVMAYQGNGGDDYHKFKGNINVQVPINSLLEDTSGTGYHEIIMEGNAYVKSNSIPFDINGGANSNVTIDMWIESSGSTNVIDHSNGNLYLNKSLYNETGDGVNTNGGTLYIDNYKIVTSGSAANKSIKSSSARNIVVNNILSSNSELDSNITNIGPGFAISSSNVG